MKKSVVVGLLVIVVIGIATGIFYAVNSGIISEPKTKYDQPLVFSEKQMMSGLWSSYKKNILEEGTLRALDKNQNGDFITTSEGQSYTMERAVWMDDQETFTKVWQWTKDNMQRQDDKLMSWKFGPLPDGKYGIQQEVGGQNTATDADVDIAYALIMASNRWKNDKYLYDALPIIKSIWQKEVVIINNEPVLVANDIERLDTNSVLINPSYFAPYAFRVFAKIDPDNDWQGLVDSSYDLLFATADATLDTPTSSGLSPNWARVNRTTGAVAPAPSMDSNYGYDAFRTPWRLALDYKYYKEPRAKQVLEKYTPLRNSWAKDKQLAAVYSHDGNVVSGESTPAAHGANLGYFIVTDPNKARDVYSSKLLTLYDPDTQEWKARQSYYDDNWAWFGMALYLDQLPNIAGEYK